MKTFKEEMKGYLKKWEASGNKVTSYVCQHCKKKIKTPQPTKKLVDSRGYWDSMKKCYECGGFNFVLIYPTGKTEVKTWGIKIKEKK